MPQIKVSDGDGNSGQEVLSDPDTELVSAIAAGDQAASKRLVERHLPWVLALARRMLGNQEDAEEIAQELFLKVWTNAEKWQPGQAKFETWMHRVALNLCYDRLRKRREITMDELPEQVDMAASPAAHLHRGQISQRVEQAMMALPDRQRTALVLCHFQGLSNIKAAEIMEISVEALESLLARGRRGLRTLLKDEASNLIGSVD